jgi:hypothetical protein
VVVLKRVVIGRELGEGGDDGEVDGFSVGRRWTFDGFMLERWEVQMIYSCIAVYYLEDSSYDT